MNTLDAIASRRSIRRFKDQPVPRELVEPLLTAAIQAPSGKNRQPWHFIVVGGEKRSEMLAVMRTRLAELKEQRVDLGSAEWSAECMEQAPVTVFVFRPNGPEESGGPMDVVDVQSIGAAIQNLLLAATDLGLGTLWICDVFYAYDELRSWLGRDDQMIAAVAIGYADESPDARPRRPLEDVTTWLER
jgi:nitroreductase